MLQGIAVALTVPILLINVVGGIIGGIWLLFRGEWGLFFRGIAWAIVSPWVLSFLMLPGLGIAALAIKFQRKKWLVYPLAFLSSMYTNFLIVTTCAGAFVICLARAQEGIGFSVIPYLLWAWGMGLGPWQYFASKEQNNEFTGLSLFFASILYFALLLSVFFPPMLKAIVGVLFFGGLLFILPGLSVWYMRALDKKTDPSEGFVA